MNFKKLGYFIFLMSLSILIVGCSGDSGESTDKKGDTKVEEKDDDLVVEDVEGGVLQVALNAQPPTLDIVLTTATAARDISQHVYESLVTLNSKLEVEPMLAETYEISEDGKNVTFHLRKGIKFHTGEEMKAADVIASMERWQGLSNSAKNFLDGTTYEEKDDYTVIAHIVKPSSLDMFIFADMTQFAAVMPKTIVEGASETGVEEYIGTGPYKYGEWKQDQYIHLIKFSEFQSRTEPADGLAGEKKAISSEIYFNFLPDPSTRVAGIISGEYDISTAIPQDNVSLLEANSDVKTDIVPSSLLVLMFNNKVGPFKDVKMRQAINAAINVEDILTAAYANEEFYVMDHALVKDKDSGWYTDEGSDIYNLFDPELSKQLLKEAGYNGEEIVLITNRDKDSFYNSALVIQQQLEAVGINLKLSVHDTATSIELKKDENNWDITVDEYAFRPSPVQQLFLGSDYLGWPDKEPLQSVTEKIIYAKTLEEAQQFSGEFHEKFWDEVQTIKVGNNSVVTAMQEDIDGYQFIAGPILWNVSKGK